MKQLKQDKNRKPPTCDLPIEAMAILHHVTVDTFTTLKANING